MDCVHDGDGEIKGAMPSTFDELINYAVNVKQLVQDDTRTRDASFDGSR